MTRAAKAEGADSADAQQTLDAIVRAFGSVQGVVDALRLIEAHLRPPVAPDQPALTRYDAGFAAGLEAAANVSRNMYAEGFDAGFASGFEAGIADAQRRPAPPSISPQVATVTTGRAGHRAVLLLPAPATQETHKWLTVGYQYALERNLDFVGTVASTADGMRDAVNMVAAGNADTLIAARPDHLWPLVQICSLAGPAEVPMGQRRTHRLYPPAQNSDATRRPQRLYAVGEPPATRTQRPEWRTGRIGAGLDPGQRHADGHGRAAGAW